LNQTDNLHLLESLGARLSNTMMYEVDASKPTVRIKMMMNLDERYEIYEEMKIHKSY